MASHNGARVILIIVTIIVFILSAVFNFLASAGGTVIFRNTTSQVSDFYSTEITPADFTFSTIWIAIYAYQALFMIYAFASILRVSGPGFMYTHPNFLPPSLYVSCIFAYTMTVIWAFLWDNEQIEAAMVFVLLSTIAAYVAVAVVSHGLYSNQKLLVSYGHGKEYRWVYFLVINPLGLYAMWLTIASLLNLSVVLVYTVDVSHMAAGSISLAVLTALVIGYSLVDLAFFERYFRYLYTPFIVLIWAFIGIMVGNINWQTSNTVFTFGLTLVTSVVFLIKVVLSFIRAFNKPLFLNTAGAMPMDGMVPDGGPSHIQYVSGPPSTMAPAEPLPSWPTLS